MTSVATRRKARFVNTVWSHYRAYKRDMPWRRDVSPYAVVVSEIMLQQTQWSRVLIKFNSWMKRFPDWQSLAKASIKEVLREWAGLGYNRRALYLKRIAEAVISNKEYGFLFGKAWPEKHVRSGRAPRPYLPGTRALGEVLHGHISPALLQKLPGIGPNTAGSIMAFAFNIPHPFIETNIRSVFIHFFFPEIEKKEGRKACKKISDVEIMLFIEKTLDEAVKKGPFKDDAREWYWALMDYGAHIKQLEKSKEKKERSGHRSAHYIKQKPFKGSNRELRSKILKLVMNKPQTLQMIKRLLGRFETTKSIQTNVSDLVSEGFLVRKGSFYMIPG